ncbi:MAG: thioredoxin [Actinomycetota bacterium]|nr:thioredoxin [Actinomycetota bacterium]
MATELTETNFETEVLASEQPVIVDFWADWCAPCRMVGPILDQIAEERAGDVRIAKVNIDEQPNLARRFGVQSIPTIVLFRDGEPAAATLGAQPKGALEKALGLVEP